MNPISSYSMKTLRSPRSTSWPWLLGSALGCSLPALAADDPTFNYNRFDVGAKFYMNIKAQLHNGSAGTVAAPYYDDGFVDTDISGNAGGKTWNWGYTSSGQLDKNNLIMNYHRATSPRDGTSSDMSQDPAWGFDLSYGRVISRFPFLHRKGAWGVEAGFSSSDITIHTSDSMTGASTRSTFQYKLVNGTAYPNFPYSGTAAGPGPLLDANEIAVPGTQSVTMTSTQQSHIDGIFYGLRLGPFIELPLLDQLTLAFSGGGVAVRAEADLKGTESFSMDPNIPGAPPTPRTFNGKGVDYMFGAYAEMKLYYEIMESASIYIGGQYQVLNKFDIDAGARSATLKLDSCYAATAGISFRF